MEEDALFLQQGWDSPHSHEETLLGHNMETISRREMSLQLYVRIVHLVFPVIRICCCEDEVFVI